MGCPLVFLMLNFIVLTEMMRQNMKHKTECNLPNPYTVATIVVFIRNILVLKSDRKFYALPHIWNLGVLTTIAYLIDLTRHNLLKCKASDFITSGLTAMFIVAISIRNPFEELFNTLDANLYSNCPSTPSNDSSHKSDVRKKVRVLKAISNKFEESTSDLSRVYSKNNSRSTQTSRHCVSKCCQHSKHYVREVPIELLLPPIPPRERRDDGDSKVVKKKEDRQSVKVEVEERKSIVVQRVQVEHSGDFEVKPKFKPQVTSKGAFAVPRKERTYTRSVKNDIINMDDLIKSSGTIEYACDINREIPISNALETIFTRNKGIIDMAKARCWKTNSNFTSDLL